MRRVVFAASVVRTDHWTTSWIDQKKGLNAGAHRVDHLLNLPGRGDLVVGLLPRLFEIRPFGSLNPAVGAGGFLGFELPSDSTDGEEPRYRCRDGKNVWIKGGHSAFLDRGHKHVEHIAGYLRARCGNPECAGVDCAECDEEIERAVSRFKTEPHHPPLCKPVAGPRLGVVLTLLLWLVLVGVVSGIGFWLVTAAGAQASKVALAYLFVVGYVLVNV